MNKAFVREPDDTGAANCPRCGSLGVPVGSETLSAQLAPADRPELAESAFYCPYPRCVVGYFDQFERWVASDKLLHPAYPKDPAAPICPCFDFMPQEIEADIAEGGTRRVKELLGRTESDDARCGTMSPSGECCRSEVQRHFMRLRSRASGGG